MSRPVIVDVPGARPLPTPGRPRHVLFLCTGNSARSIMAEAVLNRWGTGRLRAFSAGSHPAGRVHPVAIEVLSQRGYPTAGLRSSDPAAFDGLRDTQLAVFARTCEAIEARIAELVALPLDALDPATLKRRLDEIGRTPTPPTDDTGRPAASPAPR